MRVLHFDCFSGISGDMTLGALFDAGAPQQAVLDAIASLGLPITIEVDKVRKGGFAATQVRVDAPEEEEHRFLPDIEAILAKGSLTPSQRDLALRIFRRLAEAEAAAHGMSIGKVHFHEVGALDSIADIAGVAVAIDLLQIDRFTSGPVVTGSGTVKCAHGVMPIPTPATATLLKGVPLRACSLKGELTTPTGAAILTTLVDEWIDVPAMTIETIGHGAGQKELIEQPNMLRVLLGTAEVGQVSPSGERDRIWVLETNLDDVPGEIVGYAMERLFAAGALDVFSIPITMKKQRPGILLTVLASPDKLDACEEVLFQETQTFGIRRHLMERTKLRREAKSVKTPWGEVMGKVGWREGKPAMFTPEYEDCARVARSSQVPLREVYEAARRAFGEKA